MGRMLSEGVLNNFKILVRHLHGRTEEISQDSWFLDQMSNATLCKYEKRTTHYVMTSGAEQL